MTTTGRVSFVGAGPGAADLITIRGARRIAEADVVVWAPAVVDAECVREHAREGADLVDFSRVTAEEVTDLYRRAAASRLKVVRLHAGDAATGGGVQEQHDLCQRLGLEVEVVPGVSVVAAAAARIGREITLTEASSAVFLAPESSERVREFAALQTTMAATVSGARTGQFVEKLLEGGYAGDTPVVVAYKVSQADELVVHTTVGELESVVKQHKLYRPTLFLVGTAVKPPARRQSATAVTTDEPARAARPTAGRAGPPHASRRVDEPLPPPDLRRTGFRHPGPRRSRHRSHRAEPGLERGRGAAAVGPQAGRRRRAGRGAQAEAEADRGRGRQAEAPDRAGLGAAQAQARRPQAQARQLMPASVEQLREAAGRPDVEVVDAADGLRPALNLCRARTAVIVKVAPGAGPAEIGAGLAGGGARWWSPTSVSCPPWTPRMR
ncbi:hypothetical protein BBK82_22405 [Lentzea guizhouensis]|uniref:Tetrapyrrole methylase domain-containing protein n=1 Tax=Lentzea guizhouensis TaxID=1586287 RepID=A0A1B2HL01_9PSEU|nr:cobalt-precorrin-4/precorrin-4 C(11)-methyltransferase [Lentzea guizhouensis]ANZ38404.1 hypothetical protein BBK82_22405 [Lentzea guizhouensis]